MQIAQTWIVAGRLGIGDPKGSERRVELRGERGIGWRRRKWFCNSMLGIRVRAWRRWRRRWCYLGLWGQDGHENFGRGMFVFGGSSGLGYFTKLNEQAFCYVSDFIVLLLPSRSRVWGCGYLCRIFAEYRFYRQGPNYNPATLSPSFLVASQK